MQLSRCSAAKFILLASSFISLGLVALAQPTPVETKSPRSPNPGLGGLAPTMVVSGPSTPIVQSFPPMLQGVVTADEYKTFVAFQQHLPEEPALKEINARIAIVTKELLQLRKEANAIREKLIASNPAVKAIQDKIMSAMRPHAGHGPDPLPAAGAGPMPLPQAKLQPDPAKTN